VRIRIAMVMAVLAAALLLPGFARAEDDQGTGTEVVVATVAGFSDGNDVLISASTNGFADGNGAPTPASADGFSDGNGGAVAGATAGDTVDSGTDGRSGFGMSDGNG
jgi:hypothetical protein